MMKGYRKRFVLFNMLLVGVALLLVLLTQGAFLLQSSYSEMKNTMRMVVEPWDKVEPAQRSDTEAPKEDSKPPEKPEAKPTQARDKKLSEEKRNIITALYDFNSDEVSVLSDNTDASVSDAVRLAASQKSSFGTLPGGAWLYYKDASPNDCKVALVSSAYLHDKLIRTALLLAAAYLGAMALVLFISIWLAKLAAKPMEDAMQMERQFITDVSHDLKTPITVVLADCSVLKSNPDAQQQERAQWIESIETAAKKMMTLVQQMLTLSALEAKGRKIEKAPVCLSGTAERVALELDALAFERGVTVETEIAENVFVPATEEYAERICSSLLENAIKYEPDGGIVALSLKAERKKAVLAVQNRGSSISQEDLPHVFERFYRADKARSNQSGYGLGLPILKQIVDLLGAQISVKSTPEDGTVFTVIFDCTD